MKSFEKTIELKTKGELDFIDITEEIQKIVEESGIKNGICNIIVPGATGAIILNENDYSLLEDLKELMKNLVPNKEYNHPINARSHLRAILLGNNQTIPISNNKLMLGTWQQILFIELDTIPRKRKIFVKIIGE